METIYSWDMMYADESKKSVRSSGSFPPYEELRRLSKNITSILDAFSNNYDKRVRPNYGGNHGYQYPFFYTKLTT